MNRSSGVWAVAVAGFLLTASGVGAAAGLVVGMLEDVPAAAANERHGPHVRVVFRHTATGGWEAFPNDCLSQECLGRISRVYPSHNSWTISLAGLSLGTLVARTPAAFHSNQEIGLQDIVGKGSLPFVGKASIQYAGAINEPVRRPLLATSGGHKPLRSQAGWKEAAPDPDDLNRIWPAFRRLVPLIDNCPPTVPPPGDAAEAINPAVEPKNELALPAGRHPQKLELEIPVAWVARNGEALLQVSVRQQVYAECDGPRAYPRQLWFYRDAKGTVRVLPGQLDEIRADLVAPLEFSDLLRDGHDEVLFQAAGHDRGGYVLYYERFRKSVNYLWAFH